MTVAQGNSLLLSSFVCPALFTARARAARGVPTWLYRFAADWENTRLYPMNGAYHGVEMHMLFGNSREVSGRESAVSQDKLAEEMQDAWAAFARDPVMGLGEHGWPAFTAKEENLIDLGYENSPEPKFMRLDGEGTECQGVVLGGDQ